jgi:drug/metabolite transporter (DMT)-like permease
MSDQAAGPEALSLVRTVGGILCGLAATSCYNLGPALQKEGLNTLPPLTERSLLEQLKLLGSSRRWLAGFLIGIFGAIPYTAAVGLAGVTVVQPLMGFGLAVLVWYGWKRLGERIGAAAAVGIALMVVLPVLITFSRVSGSTRSLVSTQGRVLLLASFGVLAAGGILLALAARALSILYAPLAGAILALLPVCMNGAIDLIRDMRRLGGADTGGVLWVVLLGVLGLGSNIVGYYVMQIGLQRTPATRFNPVMIGVTVMVGAALGVVVFGQRIGRVPLYAAALAGVLAGLVLLAVRRRDAPGADRAPG